MMKYWIEQEERVRWAWVVRSKSGPTLARCYSKRDAETIARAMNMSEAFIAAATNPIEPPSVEELEAALRSKP